jgi:hypothetical protein
LRHSRVNNINRRATPIMKALILGCGPAGLMAAHAAAMADYEVVILSKKRKSELFGCQYLHAPIPLATAGDPVDVAYVLEGSIKDYRNKVYPNRNGVAVSPDTLETNHLAWDIRQTYDALWGMYGDYVIDVDFRNGFLDMAEMNGLLDKADVAYSTVPAPLLCKRTEDHGFDAEVVYGIGDAPERGVFAPFKAPENTILCNGESSPSWYRASNVFGYNTVEWPGGRKPPIEGVSEIVKPLKTNCDCRPNIKRLGRYGLWQKGVLSHEAFTQVRHELENDWTLF